MAGGSRREPSSGKTVRAQSISVPDLDQLAENPGQIQFLPPEIVIALGLRLMALQASLTFRLGEILLEGARRQPATLPNDDRLLTPSEAAEILNVPVRWLYRHTPRLPFARRLSRKRLRFSESGLRRYLATEVV